MDAYHRKYLNSAFGRAYRLLVGARNRAKKKRIPFTLRREHILPALAAGRCEATGIPFVFGAGRSPFSPSIDRIDSSKGYIPGNIRIVLLAFNVACGEWGEEVLWRMAAARWPERAKGELCTSPETTSDIRIPGSRFPTEPKLTSIGS